ncbi:hypothetical protein D9757_005256 [Collybiopsis confluens]|uniref:J domain-containing protein n=1 Tax=Collybiopsis confluens TaxID=2823264 RepID=A0A8H5HVP9_9AGAR|nr:hypothetical protein D9757_005256 [Collybiopsis confluens]
MPTLYQILGVRPSALPDEVRRAYKQKALETHPDKLDPGASAREKESAERRFREVHDAFSILGDTFKRKTYDAQIQIPPSLTLSWSSPSNTTDPSQYLSEETKRRMEDRAEWQRQQRLLHQTRMAEMRERERMRKESGREEVMQEEKKAEDQAKLVQEMVDELFSLTPDWERRRMEVMQRRASRLAATPNRSPRWSTVQ